MTAPQDDGSAGSRLRSPDLIYDVGAHKGEDSHFYLSLGYRVVAVEANPILAGALRRRFDQEISAGRYVVVEKAIAEHEGVISFFANTRASVWGTVDEAWASRNDGLGAASEKIDVQAVRFESLLEQYGAPHYLKIDIEGMDMVCLNALKNMQHRPSYISIESNKTSWEKLLAEFDTFESLGYHKYKIVNQKSHAPGQFPALSGDMLGYEFEREASGPFGEFLDGKWLSRHEALDQYKRIFTLYRTIGDNTPAQKVLSRVPLLRRVLGAVSWYDTHAALG